MNLYKATDLARLESHIDSETGEIDLAAFDNAQIALADKQRAVVAYIRNTKATEKMIKAAAEEMAGKAKVKQAQRERMEDYLAANMRNTGISKIEALDGTFTATLAIGRDESVVLEDGAVFPPELCNPPKPLEPSKTLIKAAILSGTPVAHASIVRNDRLTIK